MTLRSRLVLAFLAVVLVPLIVGAVVVESAVPHTVDRVARDRLAAGRAAVAGVLADTCTQSRLAAELLAQEAAATTPSAAAADVVDRRLASYAVVTDRPGRVVATAGTLGAAGAPPPDQLGSCSRGVASASAVPAVADTVDLRTRAGTALGSAGVAVLLDPAAVLRLAAASDAGVTLVVGGRSVATTLPAAAARDLARNAGRLPDDGHARVVGGRLAAAVPVGTGSLVVVTADRPTLGALELLLVLIVVLAALVATAIGVLLARVTTRPLADLSDAAARVAAGDLDVRLDVRSGDEVGRLSRSFNEMASDLRDYVGALERSRDELRHTLTRLGDTLSGTHDLRRIVDVATDTAVAATGAHSGAVLLLSPSGDELVVRGSRGLDTALRSARVPVSEGVVGAVATSAKPLRGRPADLVARPSVVEMGVADVVCVPLRARGRDLGVLLVRDRADGQPFDDADESTLRSFGLQSAAAIDNVRLHQEAERLSLTDALTGVANYRSFQATLSREVERATRFDRPLALVMLDLDRFKDVNDVHGHQTGDAVLVELANRLGRQIREVDVLARYGGEEFVLVLPETARDGAAQAATKVVAAVAREAFEVDTASPLRITVSAGVAVFPEHGTTPAALVRAADQALYRAKAAGRNGWAVASQPAAATDQPPSPPG